MFPSVFASLRSDPISRAHYQRKRDQADVRARRSSPRRATASLPCTPLSATPHSTAHNPAQAYPSQFDKQHGGLLESII